MTPSINISAAAFSRTPDTFLYLRGKPSTLKTNYQSLYVAYDQFPSYKGAATHIYHMVETLDETVPETLLATLAPKEDCTLKVPVAHHKVFIDEQNFLKRAQRFSAEVDALIEKQSNLVIGHFRDVWGGVAVLNHPHMASIFEVNSLPSIELPYRYPLLPSETLDKIKQLEEHCLTQSDIIICPSEVIKKHLVANQITENKIHVVTNGADLPEEKEAHPELPENYLLYFGAVQPWQGVDILLKSLNYLQDMTDLKLVICCANQEKFTRPLKKLARNLDLEDRVIWLHQQDKRTLQQIIQHALCTIAPLTECSRNIEQGCSPLKIFESMACGTPIIASDLPVVREILTPDHDGKFFRPGRPAELARCIRLLYDYPEIRDQLGNNAKATLVSKYQWPMIKKQLSTIYEDVLTNTHQLL